MQRKAFYGVIIPKRRNKKEKVNQSWASTIVAASFGRFLQETTQQKLCDGLNLNITVGYVQQILRGFGTLIYCKVRTASFFMTSNEQPV